MLLASRLIVGCLDHHAKQQSHNNNNNNNNNSSNRIFLDKICVPHGKSACTVHMYADLHACKLRSMQLDETVTRLTRSGKKCFCELCCCLVLLAVQSRISVPVCLVIACRRGSVCTAPECCLVPTCCHPHTRAWMPHTHRWMPHTRGCMSHPYG